MWIGVKRQLAVVIAHREGGKENIARQIQNTARQISETVRNRTHVHTNIFFRMTDTMTAQNIDLSSWDTLYIYLYMCVKECCSRAWRNVSTCANLCWQLVVKLWIFWYVDYISHKKKI
jgi:hypothetical protein